MSVKICTAEYMISDANGFGFARSWFPRIVRERFAVSTRDSGTVDRAPDAIAFIDTDLTWTNDTAEDQHLTLGVHKASRQIITSNPNTVALDDAVTWDVGPSPVAPTPAIVNNGMGARLKTTRNATATLELGRMFREDADSIHYEEIGLITPGNSVHVRYRALYTTPGVWRSAVAPRHEAFARWCRLRLWASPYVTGVI